MKAEEIPGEVMGIRGVAKYLDVAPVTVYRLLAKEKIPARKVGGQWRFVKEEIERWLVEREIENRSFSNCSCI
jgi:excisionase family DNA binding protein